jgi:uncharacterized protein (DUF1778 family)
MARKAQQPRKTLRETPLQIRLTAEEKQMFTEAAEREHLTLSAWIRLAALHAAKSNHAVK